MKECPLNWLQIHGTLASWRVFSLCKVGPSSCSESTRDGCIEEFRSRLGIGLEMLRADEAREQKLTLKTLKLGTLSYTVTASEDVETKVVKA